LISDQPGGGRAVKKKHGKAPKARGLPKERRFWGRFGGIRKGETLAKFLFCLFFGFFGHVGARGAQMDTTTFFLKILRVEAFLQ